MSPVLLPDLLTPYLASIPLLGRLSRTREQLTYHITLGGFVIKGHELWQTEEMHRARQGEMAGSFQGHHLSPDLHLHVLPTWELSEPPPFLFRFK